MPVFSSLRFPEAQKERDFTMSRLRFLVINMRIFSMLAALLSAMVAFLLAAVGHLSGPHKAPLLFSLTVIGIDILFSFSLFFYLRRPAAILSRNHDVCDEKTALNPDHFERLFLLYLIYMIFTVAFCDQWRSARLFGVHPEDAWTRTLCEGEFSDSSTLLMLDAIMTGVCLFLPIRTHMLLAVPLAGPFCFVLTTVIGGSSESHAKVLLCSTTLICISYFSFTGARMVEIRERERFEETFAVRREMIKERVARCDLEHDIEQRKISNTMMHGQEEGSQVAANHVQGHVDSLAYSASGTASSGRLPPRTLGRSSETASRGELTTGSLALTEPESAIQIELANGHAEQRNSLTDPSGTTASTGTSQTTEESAQTDLCWIESGGFKCLRCSRPPKALSVEEEQERMIYQLQKSVQKYGKPRRLSRMQRPGGDTSSLSSSSSSSSQGQKQTSSSAAWLQALSAGNTATSDKSHKTTRKFDDWSSTMNATFNL